MNINRIKQNTLITESGCWEWQRSTNSAGYGQLTENKVYWLAHRYALSCITDVAPSDKVRHMCHNPLCCNPDHLKTGTDRDNYHDSIEVHRAAQQKLRKKWSVNGVEYQTCKDAKEKTGLSYASLVKYTVDGVFDIESYRNACAIARWVPKV